MCQKPAGPVPNALNSKAAKNQFQLSPQGKYGVWYDYVTKRWFSVAVAFRKPTNLTEKTGVSLAGEANDSPDNPQPYGLAAWTKARTMVISSISKPTCTWAATCAAKPN